MPRKGYTTGQIITKLPEPVVELAKGQAAAQVCRAPGNGGQPYHRPRREYGGLRVDQASRLKDFERENTRPDRVPQMET